MSQYLYQKICEKCNNIVSEIKESVSSDDIITLYCSIHGNYNKSVHQILYKNHKCPICVRIAKNKHLSDIGKTKVGKLNNFYRHKHSEETLNKLRKPLAEETKKKISDKVKSKDCQDRTKQTRRERYGSDVYVNSAKMKETKMAYINQYMKDNNCSLVSDIECTYGGNWRHLGLVDIIIYKNHAFIKNEDIYKIIEYKKTLNPKSGMSHKEKDLVKFIKSFYNGQILENKRSIIPPQELDIYLPDIKLAIEFNGNYWHAIEQGFDKQYHLNKSLKCAELGIRLIHIYEFENFEKQKYLLKSLILGVDKYPKNDFNKNNFLNKIPKLYKNITNKGTIYSIGPVIEEVS